MYDEVKLNDVNGRLLVIVGSSTYDSISSPQLPISENASVGDGAQTMIIQWWAGVKSSVERTIHQTPRRRLSSSDCLN